MTISGRVNHLGGLRPEECLYHLFLSPYQEMVLSFARFGHKRRAEKQKIFVAGNGEEEKEKVKRT